MIAPRHADGSDAGRARHNHVEAGIADHDRARRFHARLCHRRQDHSGVGFGGICIGRLDCGESTVPIIFVEQPCHPAPRLAGGDAEHGRLVSCESCDGFERAGVEGVFAPAMCPLRRKAAAECSADPVSHGGAERWRQRVDRLRYRQPNDRQRFAPRRRREPVALERMLHRRDDVVLAVHQRAVAIEQDEGAGHGSAGPSIDAALHLRRSARGATPAKPRLLLQTVFAMNRRRIPRSTNSASSPVRISMPITMPNTLSQLPVASKILAATGAPRIDPMPCAIYRKP